MTPAPPSPADEPTEPGTAAPDHHHLIVPGHLLPDEATAALASAVLAPHGGTRPGEESDRGARTVRSVAARRARAALGDEETVNVAARVLLLVGMPLLAGEVVLDAAAAALDEGHHAHAATDLRDLNSAMWPPAWETAAYTARLRLVRALQPAAGAVRPLVDLAPVLTLATADRQTFQAALHRLLRAAVHNGTLAPHLAAARSRTLTAAPA